jgi:cell division protein FtsI/penicillin-binding protein 2
LVFGMLGVVPVFLTGWLGHLQVLQAGELARGERPPLPLVAATADRQGVRAEVVPAPRATIVDRRGNLLALDREVYEVRARLAVPPSAQKSVGKFVEYLAELTVDLARAMVADPELANRAAAEVAHRERMAAVLGKAFATAELLALGAAAPLPPSAKRSADVLLGNQIETLAVVEALRELDARRTSLQLDFVRSYRRDYLEREATFGFVGHVETVWRDQPDGGKQLATVGKCGLEALPVALAGSGRMRPFRADGRGRPYFTNGEAGSPEPAVLHATLDLDLQRAALEELARQAESPEREGKGSNPQWGALVLVEIATGDVLAAASWHREVKSGSGASWAPYQNLFEPGSIVKPLVIAYAGELGKVDWDHEYDCTPGGAEYRTRIAALGRAKSVSDDHACGRLTPHGILVNSSNIGATYLGLGLEREHWRDYMGFFGFGTTLGFGLPGESKGGPNPRSFLSNIPLKQFRANSAVSFSFGYELQVTALQVARAYLRLLRGAASELRLVRGLQRADEWQPQPVSPTGEQLSPEVFERVRGALVDVVGEDPHATGAVLRRQFLAEGIELHGLVAGKTGTAVSSVGTKERGKVEVRNASFAGFLPADAPRWLAVGVLQRDDRGKFYGGAYAGPAVVRLLLQAQRLAERQLLQQEAGRNAGGQVRAAANTPVDPGWRATPETTSVGR